MPLTLADAYQSLAGFTTLGDEDLTTRVVTDSRMVREGDLFFCIAGERFDGHAFADQALAKGAAAVVSSRILENVDIDRVIMVRDTVAALGRLAAHYRAKCGRKVAAVTGSAGKTTVKEMLATIMSECGSVARNKGNFNNQIGLPMSMLAASGNEDFWVMEVGISQPGDMEELGPVASPDLAVITNVGLAHTEGLGGLSGVVRAKTTLLKYLAPGGEAVVSMDYPALWECAQAQADQVYGFSTRELGADCLCRYLGPKPEGGLYHLELPGLDIQRTFPVYGAQFAESMAAAALAAHRLGASTEHILRGLENTPQVPGRFMPRVCDGFTVIDDTYNANPLSMSRSAKSARDMAGAGPLVLVLGDMLELGSDADDAHEKLGMELAALKPEAVFFQGRHAEHVHRGLLRSDHAGVWKAVDGPAQFMNEFDKMDLSAATILVKGSRSCRMERYVGVLCNQQEELGRAV